MHAPLMAPAMASVAGTLLPKAKSLLMVYIPTPETNLLIIAVAQIMSAFPAEGAVSL